MLGNLVPRFSESLVADNDGLSCVAKSDAGTSLWVKSKFGYVPSPLPAERLAHNPERPLDLFWLLGEGIVRSRSSHLASIKIDEKS